MFPLEFTAGKKNQEEMKKDGDKTTEKITKRKNAEF